MKVLVVTPWLPTAGRPETGIFVQRDIEMLREDHDVEVIHLSADGEMATVGFPVTTVRMSTTDPRSIRRAGAIIVERAARVDLVHSMAASALLPFLGHRVERPWVHTEHWSALLAPDTAPRAARASLPLVRAALRRPDVVVAVGNDLARAVQRTRRGPTVVIPNAVQRPTVVHPRPRTGGLTLVGVGGLIERKGPDIAVRMVAELRERGEDARLLWAGDGPMREALLSLAAELGIADHVELRGRVAPAQVEALLAEADVFVLPTRMETFGVAIAEALVAGRPVVVSASGEQRSFVSEPDGVLVDAGSPRAYADAVQRVQELNRDRSAPEIAAAASALFDPEERRTATQAAYRTAIGRGVAPLPRDVDVVIAAHDPRRDIARAVSSVLTSRSVRAVHVVCHNIEEAAIREAAGTAAQDDRVRFLELRDDVRSPAGPFNLGIAEAAGAYVAVMGSDDELTTGAIDAWRRTAQRDDADVVIAPLRHAAGRRVPTPPTLRQRRLRGRRDRLAYRTAPLGLIATSRFGGLRFTEGLATGEDLDFGVRLWFSAAEISVHQGPGEYLIHDGEERVTFAARPLGEELQAVRLLLEGSFAPSLGRRDREALAVKLWRVTVFGAIHYRAGAWVPGDREALREIIEALRSFSPGAVHVLSTADRDLIVAAEEPGTPDGMLDELSRRRRRFVSVKALLPARPALLWAREAPLRFSAATWWVGRR
ncbi:glycosyltransferase [Microbacterium sp. K36]|uniref:glycosyltransferase n=1 Tax=Microbacterium sp. K36 TaxID=2305439 RepID=UPI00109CC385|nr:glycosyltransferase [Microbacterium sp. K36]